MDTQAKRVEDLSQYGKALNSVPEWENHLNR